MRITIKDCLSLPAFENAEVLAGKEKLEETIKKISVLEATLPEDLDTYDQAEDQMFVTGFFGNRQNVDVQCEISKKLAICGAVVLVLYKVGEVMKEVDDRLIETCKAVGLTLIVLDGKKKTSLSEIIEEVSQTLFFGTTDKFNNGLITNTVLHLLNFDKYVDFPGAIKAAALNNDFQMVILSNDFNPVLTVETRHKATIKTAVRIAKEKSVEKRSSVYTRIDVEGVVTYWGPIEIADNQYYMFIVDNKDSFSIDDVIKLVDIISVAMRMWKYTPENDKKAELVQALRRGNLRKAYSLKEDIDIDESNILSVFLASGFEDMGNQAIVDKYCSEHGLVALQIREGDETFGVILGDCMVSTCAKLFDEVKATRKTKLYHVTGIAGVEGACDAFKLINETWGVAQNVFPFKRAFSKYDLSLINNCNNIQVRGGFTKRSYMKLLEVFDEERSTKGKQLLETLETFALDAGMSGTKTAEIMNVHTNTVQYRLKRISEILGVEITANRIIPGLTIALALKRLERI